MATWAEHQEVHADALYIAAEQLDVARYSQAMALFCVFAGDWEEAHDCYRDAEIALHKAEEQLAAFPWDVYMTTFFDGEMERTEEEWEAFWRSSESLRWQERKAKHAAMQRQQRDRMRRYIRQQRKGQA
jgi:hypothetical protein